MRNSLEALTEELKRLKDSGVETVSVSPANLTMLKQAVSAWNARHPPMGQTAPPATPPTRTATPPPPPARTPAPPAPIPPPVPALPPPPILTLPAGEKAARWAALRALMNENPICRAQVRPGKQLVLGTGSLDARIMFVGDAPGAEEESAGEPFVGPAGQLLDRMIVAMGLKRGDVYLCNVMNWRPRTGATAGEEEFRNQPPTPAEIAYCLPYLHAQLAIVEPQLLVVLGMTAAQALFSNDSFKNIGEIRGCWRVWEGRSVMPTFHPNYLLKSNSNRTKRQVWEDLLQVMEQAGLAISDRQRGFFAGK